jgi:hypothetical protein
MSDYFYEPDGMLFFDCAFIRIMLFSEAVQRYKEIYSKECHFKNFFSKEYDSKENFLFMFLHFQSLFYIEIRFSFYKKLINSFKKFKRENLYFYKIQKVRNSFSKISKTFLLHQKVRYRQFHPFCSPILLTVEKFE